MRRFALVGLALALAVSCAPDEAPGTGAAGGDEGRLDYAIAIHGGAGTLDRSKYAGLEDDYLEALRAALERGRSILDGGGSALDAVEQVIVLLEDDPGFNAGKGAVYNFDGEHELDASIMDGRDLSCGAVAGVRTIKNPIVLARKVMELSPHVLFGGAGAEQFADEVGVERVGPDYFHTERRRESWREFHEKHGDEPAPGTVGVVALDREGNLAAGTSTGGITGKRFGRVGDSPIVGAGTYADNRTCAVSGTGKGEEYIRHAVAARVSMLVGVGGMSLEEAVDEVMSRRLAEGDGGIIAVDRFGNVAMAFNTGGMFRGAADSSGRFEVAIW